MKQISGDKQLAAGLAMGPRPTTFPETLGVFKRKKVGTNEKSKTFRFGYPPFHCALQQGS